MNENRKRATKKDIYAQYGIEYRTSDGKINVPVFGWVKPLLKNGNKKIGKGSFHFSIAPTDTKSFTFTVNGKEYSVCGTCACTCRNAETGKIECYACTGHYVQNNVKASLGINTFLARYALDFLKRAITAQLIADKVKVCRVHVAGDFFGIEYVNLWQEIAKAFPYIAFWTYTKTAYENEFDEIENFNVVKSIIKGYGYNFGECGYIIALFNYLKSQGKSVYICLCGLDDENAPKCFDCAACRTYEHVLFIKHSCADYDAKKDPLFDTLVSIAKSQKAETIAA